MSFDFRVFFANHDGGDCDECGIWFVTGDSIGYDENDKLVHADCWTPENLYAEPKPRVFDFSKARRKQ